MEKEKTEKYVVIKKHTLGHTVGAVVELTEKKAKNLVGKVRLASEEISEDNISAVAGKLQGENNDLKAEVTKLGEEIKTLKAKLKSREK